jgi:hypothetical protein
MVRRGPYIEYAGGAKEWNEKKQRQSRLVCTSERTFSEEGTRGEIRAERTRAVLFYAGQAFLF